MPKHLLDIISEQTIIQETVQRIRPLIAPDHVIVVTGASHAEELIRQLPDVPRGNVIIEPIGRNTAPCIGLAALAVRKNDPDGLMVVLPSDHMIADEPGFLDVLSVAAAAARQGDYLLTIGIEPTGPETGYGYIEQGNQIDAIRDKKIHKVKSIREKPDLESAKAFLRQGGFLWNSGMFVWRASVILAAMAKWLPDIHQALMAIEPALGTAGAAQAIEDAYQTMAGVSIDYGVMEKAENTLVIPGNFGWSDVGSWDALWDISDKDETGNAVKGPCIAINAANCLIQSPKKLVALVDVEDLLVVETDDALLICRRGASQNVKQVVEKLAEMKKTDYL